MGLGGSNGVANLLGVGGRVPHDRLGSFKSDPVLCAAVLELIEGLLPILEALHVPILCSSNFGQN